MTIQRYSQQEKKEKLLQFIKEKKALRKKTKPTLVKTGRKPLVFLVKFRKIQVPRRLVAKIKRMARKVSLPKKRVITPEASAEIPRVILLSRQERKEKLLQFVKEKKGKLLETKRRKEEIRLKAIAKKESFKKEKAGARAKILDEKKAKKQAKLVVLEERDAERAELLTRRKKKKEEAQLKAIVGRKVLQEKSRVLQAKASVSRKEKKEKILQFIKGKKEVLSKAKETRQEVHLKALAKRKALAEEKSAAKAKALASQAEKKEKLLQFIRERKTLRKKKFKPTFAKKRRKFSLPSLAKTKKFIGGIVVRVNKVSREAVVRIKKVVQKAVPAKKKITAEVVVKAPAVKKPKKIGKLKRTVKPVLGKAAKKKIAVPKIELKVLLRKYGLRIFFFLLLLAWLGEVYIFYSKIYFKKQESDEVTVQEEKKPPEKKAEIKVVMRTQDTKFTEIKIVGERDPFSSELFRTGLLVKQPKFIGPIRPIIKAKKPTEKPIVIPPLISEGEKLSALVSVSKPRVPEVSLPSPTCSLRYRGALEIAGIEYLFIEGKKPHQTLIGDTIEGYRLFNKLGDTIYLSKKGNIFQLQREVLLCPLHYRGRLIMDGKEYLFLEGKRTYRVTLGGTAEGYQIIRRIGNILYLLKDNNIFELKEE